MEILPYNDFSSLHIRQFFPDSAGIREDADGLEQSVLGFNRCRHYFAFGFTFFCYLKSPPRKLAAIDVDLREGELPPTVAASLLHVLQLPVRNGMTATELHSLFGGHDYASETEANPVRFYRFVCGSRCPYVLGFHVHAIDGLNGFWIVRQDYFPRES
jgi:hypothetical protein